MDLAIVYKFLPDFIHVRHPLDTIKYNPQEAPQKGGRLPSRLSQVGLPPFLFSKESEEYQDLRGFWTPGRTLAEFATGRSRCP
jgi:hypothetical protein